MKCMVCGAEFQGAHVCFYTSPLLPNYGGLHESPSTFQVPCNCATLLPELRAIKDAILTLTAVLSQFITDQREKKGTK